MRTHQTRPRVVRGVLLALAGSVVLAACGSSSSTSSSSTTAAKATSSTAAPAAPAASARVASGKVGVTIAGFAYQPATITVKPGTKITFTNHDQTAHTATTNHTGFDSGTLAPGKSATVTLSKPGTYTYYCQFHAFMHGTVVVK
jgi:plastocyanin